MSENIFLETERLILRRFTMDDVDHIAAQDGDPEVMRYVADGLPKTRRDAEEGVARVLLNYEKFPGLGIWIAEEKPHLAFAGWFALKYIPKTEEIEVGYRLMKSAWGRGLATEGARAMLRYGFGERGLDALSPSRIPTMPRRNGCCASSAWNIGASATTTAARFHTS